MTNIQLTTRNADLADLVALLKDQEARKQDIVAPLSAITSANADFIVQGSSLGVPDTLEQMQAGETGDRADLRFRLTAIADGHVAAKLGIPVSYVRTLRTERPDLYDANVNGWIHGDSHTSLDPQYPADDRSVLLRTFMSDGSDEPGVLRALMSDRYGIIDNFDVLTAALSGVRETGTPIEVLGADLTETRMTVRIAAPEVMANAPDLLKDYRSPFQDGDGIDHSGGRWTRLGSVPQWAQEKFGVNPDGVFAGLVITNSETGGGAFSIVPRLMVLRCTNGLMMTKDALRRIHVGGKLEEGTVQWSRDTEQKALELITAQARDAVKAFLDPAYVALAVQDLTAKASVPLENPADCVEFVAKKLVFTEEQRDGILDHFMRGGQITAGGIMQAVTSFAQTVEDAEDAFTLEASATKALDLAAAFA